MFALAKPCPVRQTISRAAPGRSSAAYALEKKEYALGTGELDGGGDEGAGAAILVDDPSKKAKKCGGCYENGRVENFF